MSTIDKADSHPLKTRVSKASSPSVPEESVVNQAKLPASEPSRVKTEPVRFSVRRDLEQEGGSVGRILLYIFVVIAVGVGAVFLVQNYVNNQNAAQDAQADQQAIDQEVINGADIGKVTLADADANVIKANEVFSNSNLTLGSKNNNIADVQITKLTHQIYTTFTRTTWDLAGVTNGLPPVNVSYANADRVVSVQFTGITVSEQDLMQTIEVTSGNVSSITGSQEGDVITFELQLDSPSKYVAYIQGGDKLVLDIKTEEQLSVPAEEVEVADDTTSEEETSLAGDPDTIDKPDTAHYDNEASTSKQYVVSNNTGNGIYSETYYYIDYGDSFQFSWAMRNVGEASIPNAEAELITKDGKPYVQVKISNLGYDLLHSQGKEKANITIPLTSTNVVGVFTNSFTNGVATYLVELRHEGKFRLHSTLDYNSSQLLSLQVMD